MAECVSAALHPEMWDIKKLRERVGLMFGTTLEELSDEEFRDMAETEIRIMLQDMAVEAYEKKESELGEEPTRQIERMLLLQHTDQFWKDHLLAMDRLRGGIGLRGYGQRNPLWSTRRKARTCTCS